jgi:hypothetical protein
VTSTPFQDPEVAKSELLTIQIQLHDAVSSNNTIGALEHFDTTSNPQAEASFTSFIKREREALSQDGFYNPQIVPNGIIVIGNEAQVLLEEEADGKPIMIRRDLTRSNGEWKITESYYNKPLDLEEADVAHKLEDALSQNATYTSEPSSYDLIEGDTLHVYRTDWQQSSIQHSESNSLQDTIFSDITKYDFVGYQDFLFIIPQPKRTYTVVLFNAPYASKAILIQRGNTSGNYGPYSSFDLRDINGDIAKSVLLVYEGNMLIDTKKPGVPEGWILSVPIQISS